MPSATVRHPKGPVEDSPQTAARPFVQEFVESSVGGKLLMALTGAGLVGFVTFHMIGNLKFLSGPEAINHYAHFLKHDLGALLWIARGGLLAIFLLHIALAIRLTRKASAARPVPYSFPRSESLSGSAQAGYASRLMFQSGSVIGLFVLFHLVHFTFAWVQGVEVNGTWTNFLDLRDSQGRHDVFEMMYAGFSNSILVAIYVGCQVVLFVHLRHGIQSVFQTLGLKNGRFRKPIDALGLALALFVLLGNLAIVFAVKFGWVASQYR
jgi:succinate dehydrogenase / fumarate reductase cytochrome b subunit